MTELGQTIWPLIEALTNLVVAVGALVLYWSLLLAWIAWWLWGVNWDKAWPLLARGVWVPVALLAVMAALVWSRIAPGDWETVPNFWWQLGAVGLVVGLAFFCGWLQGVLGWHPAELSLEPPVATVHAHGHHDDHPGPEHRHVEELPRNGHHSGH